VRHAIKLPHGDLLLAVSKLITKSGKFALILPHIEGLRFIDLAKRYNLFASRITQVHSKHGRPVERLLIELSKEIKDPQKSILIIQHEDSDQFDESYISLTKDFYLKF
jgi:tRNA1Val (adenine37-N6)-methyltransferase